MTAIKVPDTHTCLAGAASGASIPGISWGQHTSQASGSGCTDCTRGTSRSRISLISSQARLAGLTGLSRGSSGAGYCAGWPSGSCGSTVPGVSSRSSGP